MSTAFAHRITSLRKEKGLSQKEVAMSLGVSQALLSHYEKGVRECGLEFVIRCADYFGVTTDYLLGKDESKYGLYNAATGNPNKMVVDLSGDKIDMRTVIMCVSLIAENYDFTDPFFGDKLFWGAAISEYKLLVTGIESGRFSEDWLDVEVKWDDPVFQNLTDAVYKTLLETVSSKITTVQPSSGKFPPFVNALVKNVEEYVSRISGKYVEEKTN